MSSRHPDRDGLGQPLHLNRAEGPEEVTRRPDGPYAYRDLLYANYARAQTKSWLTPDQRADARWITATLRRLHGWLPDDRRIRCLDLGCGAGQVLQLLSSTGYSDLRGVDLSSQAVKLARKRGFEVVEEDLLKYLRTSSERFGLIIAFDVIEHFTRDELLELLDLVWKHLEPGGRVIIQTPNALSPWAASYRYGDMTHEWIFDPILLASVLELVGFVRWQFRGVTPYVHGFKTALRWLVWKAIWAGCAVWNLAEIGSMRGGVYTRNMACVAFRPEIDEATEE